MRGNNYARYTNSHKFGKSVAQMRAADAIREGDALRKKLEGRRILPCLPLETVRGANVTPKP